jgi:hypothetical protein
VLGQAKAFAAFKRSSKVSLANVEKERQLFSRHVFVQKRVSERPVNARPFRALPVARKAANHPRGNEA